MLIKSVLSSILTYFMLLQAPVSLMRKLEKLQRDFSKRLDKRDDEVSLGKLEAITTPKHWGALGVKDLKFFNKALLVKWLWRFGKRRVLLERSDRGEYRVLEGGWRTKMLHFEVEESTLG